MHIIVLIHFDTANKSIMAIPRKQLHDKIPEIDESIQYLKSCEDFSSDVAYRHMNRLNFNKRESDCEDPVGLRKHIGSTGFGSHFPKMWKSLCTYMDEDDTKGYHALKAMLLMFANIADSSPELGVSLGECGGIPLLFSCLKQVKDRLTDDIRRGVNAIAHYTFMILHNAIRSCPSNIIHYRNSNAVAVLREFIELGIYWQFKSIVVLAYVATESEKSEFASSKVCVRILTNLLKDAVASHDHHAELKGVGTRFSAFEVLSAINQLAINDDVKTAVSDDEAIPSIIKMLQNDFSSDEQRASAVALCNLAFIEDLGKSEELQGTIPSK